MSLLLGKYFKGPTERKRYHIDYSDWLDTGELVSTVTFGVTPSTGTPVLIDGDALELDSKGVVFYASAGLSGVSYRATVTMQTTNGQTRADVVQFTVRTP